jgi:hypothetical protein
LRKKKETEEMKSKLILIAAAVLLAASIGLVYAWNVEGHLKKTSVIYDKFWVQSDAYGQSIGTYFTNWDNIQWSNGVGVDGPPPYFYCTYSHHGYHFPPTNPVVVESFSDGTVVDKYGEFAEYFYADEVITP